MVIICLAHYLQNCAQCALNCTNTTNLSECVLYSGVWNVPFISSAVLIQGQWLLELWKRQDMPQYHSHIYESDMAFCQWMRDRVSVYQCVFVLWAHSSVLIGRDDPKTRWRLQSMY